MNLEALKVYTIVGVKIIIKIAALNISVKTDNARINITARRKYLVLKYFLTNFSERLFF
jgi:hypothetical protein